MCSCGWDSKFFLFRYDIAELNLLVDALEGKLSAIYRWARLDLGLALSSCISKDNGQVPAPSGPFPVPSGENFGSQANSLPLSSFKGKDSIAKVSTDLALSVGRTASMHKGAEVVLALEAMTIPPIKLSCQMKQKSDPGDQLIQRSAPNIEESTMLGLQLKSSHVKDDVICLSDDETEESNKPKETVCGDGPVVSEMAEVADHKLNLCDLANAALAAEANLNSMSYGQKDDCFSCSTSPKGENDIKDETAALADEHNLSYHQGSMSSSVEKRDPDASTPDSFIQNIDTALRVGCGIKVRDESLMQRSDMRVLDDARALPGSPSCSQSSVDKNHRQKGPRIAKVVRRINCNVEPLEFGMVIPGNLWSNSRAIFAKGLFLLSSRNSQFTFFFFAFPFLLFSLY